MYKNLILPAGLLAGTIIGAGIFALPFIFKAAGTITGLFYLVIFSGIFVLVHLMYADVIIKTDPPATARHERAGSRHNFPGYVKIYLGKGFFGLANLTSVLGLLLTLIIYLVLSASFLNLILPANFGIPDIFKILFFWLIGSAAIFLGTKRLAFSEFLTTSSIVLIALGLFSFGVFNFSRVISGPAVDFKNIFLPYGVVLFSLMGRVAIPSVIDYFRKITPGSEISAGSAPGGTKMQSAEILLPGGQPLNHIRNAIILGTAIPTFVYLLFVFGVLGLSGKVSEDAVSGLINNVSPFILILVGIFGFISVLDSYNVVGLDIKNSLRFDWKFPKLLAGLAVVIAPLILFLLGFQNFLVLVGFVGGIFIALEGIFIVLMWHRAYKVKPEAGIFKKLNPLIIYALIIVFIIGIVYQLIH